MIENSDDEKEFDPKTFKKAKENTIVKELTHKHYEKWEVAQLANDPEPISKPISKPTEIIEKLNENRKQQHEFLLAKLAEDLNDVNTEIENNIRLCSEEVKAQLHSYKEKLNKILDGINTPDVAYCCGPVFLNIQLQAEQLRNENLNLVNELYNDLLEFENVRRKKNEKIFHEACEGICKNGFMLPYELQCFVEQEILKMDQLVLNNRRCYEDLKLKLTLIIMGSFRTFVDKMVCVKERWVRHELEEAKKKMMVEHEEKIQEEVKLISRLELKGEELIIDSTPDGVHSTCDVKTWLANINSVVNEIEKYGNVLTEMYKKMLDAVFFNFSSRVETIRNELNDMKLLEFEERIIQPILFQAKKEESCNVEMLEAYWQETLNEIQITLEDVIRFLFATGKLWEKHHERVSELKKKIVADWEEAVKQNEAVLEDLEGKLNNELGNLRQEYDKCKMEKLYSLVLQLMGDLKINYEANYAVEVNIIEEFFNLMKEEAEILSSEIKEFIYGLYPLEVISSCSKIDVNDKNSPGNKFIHAQIRMCLARVKKIPSWRQGVWKALEGLSQNTVESLEKISQEWVATFTDEVDKKLQSQLEKHDERLNYVRTNVYEIRIKEVKAHQSTIEKHKIVVEQKLRKIKLELKWLLEKQTEGLNKLAEFCYETGEKIKKDYRTGVIACLQIQVKNRRKKYEEEIANANVEFLRECESRLMTLKKSNDDLMDSMKLFSDGGNYHADEVKIFKTELEAIDFKLKKESKIIENELKQFENEAIKKLNELLEPVVKTLNNVYDELQFNDSVLSEISRYTKTIQEIALHTKSDFNHLRNLCEKMFDSLRDSNHRFLKQDVCWFSIVRSIYKNISNIFYPVKLPEGFEEVEEDGQCSDDLDFSTKATISYTDTLPSFRKGDGFVCKDYKEELFKSKTPPENNFTFMAIVCNKLWGYMDNLQRLACMFYRKFNKREVLRNDLILGNYDLFAENMLIKLQYYNVQCEQLWLSIIQEFLPVLTRLKEIFNKYVERQIWDLEKKIINEIIYHHQEFMKTTNEFMNQANCELKKLDDRLLTLHGHPNNQNLLNELEDDVVSVTARLEANWEVLIENYKAELISFENRYVKEGDEMREIEDHCQQIKKAIFIDEFGPKLLNTILKYTEKGGYFIKRHSKNFHQPRAPPSTPTELSTVPSSYDLNLFPLGTETQTVQMHLIELEDLLNSDSDTRLNLSIEAVNCEEIIKNSLKSIEDFIKELFWIADSQKNVFEEKNFKWLEIWKCNVKKVKKLFAVKYSEQNLNILMAEVKKNKKNERTVHISLPKVLPKKKIEGPVIHSPSRKSRSVESRSFSSEKKKRSGNTEYQQINLDKLDTSDNCSEQKRYASNSSLGSLSPNKRFSQIPIPSRFQINNQRPISPVKTRSPSPILKKSPKANVKNKTIIVEPELILEKLNERRPISPVKKIGFIRSSTPKPDIKPKPFFCGRVKEEKHHEIKITPRSPKKKSSKTTLTNGRPASPMKKKITKSTTITSRKAKPRKNEGKPSAVASVPPTESPDKIYNEKSSSFEDFNIPESAGIDLFAEFPSKGSFFDLDVKKSETGMHIPLSLKSSQLSCRKSPSVIRTISGHELVLSPSFEFDVENEDDDIAFSQLLKETEKKLDDKFSKLQVFHDDANEYDSEATTDSIPTYNKKIKSDEARREKIDQARKNYSNLEVKNNKWKNHEEELLNDVLYRQAMYHPAIVRQKNQEENSKLEKNKSWSIERGLENIEQGSDGVARKRSVSKNNFKRKPSPTSWNKNGNVSNIRSWNEKNVELHCKEVCKELEKIQDVPKIAKGPKRERTRKERIAAALLRFAAKTIRLLVLFNLWPGGNIFFLTSNLLRSK